MAKEEQNQEEIKEKKEIKPEYQKPQVEEKVIRVLSKDIPGRMTVYAGLTRIKGISWGISNAICKLLNIDKRKKVLDLTEQEINKISEFIKNPKFPKHLPNRAKDLETGEDKHLVTSDLELRKDFDIKKLKKIKSYRGLRHGAGLPTRGQRTRSNFRRNRKKGAGIKSKKK